MIRRNKIYFASDLHLGAPDHEKSLEREKHFVQWLTTIEDETAELYLLGDIFDFWFEYRHAVPKGFVRMLGKLAEMSDKGVVIHIFTGNHDLWYRDYLAKEIGAFIYDKPVIREIYGRKFYFAHGDGLGPGDTGYKWMKKVFTNRLNQWLFARLHPDYGIRLAHFFSSLSQNHNYDNLSGQEVFHHGNKEYLYVHVRNVLKRIPDIQVFVFGHRHILIHEEIEPQKELILLGDWIQYFSFLEVSEKGLRLDVFPIGENQKLPLHD
ncbi:MAG: UDP-2,3-diacylglucosamine diphosphatase [Bacteroidia bacterium]|nr:UDP-2,3-diacylglucosamine diphosphatase [Bacteroidia bacterium]